MSAENTEVKPKRRRSRWRSSLIGLVGMALLIAIPAGYITIIGRSFRIPSASMVPTLQVGDYISSRPLARGDMDEIRLGDIVVHTQPNDSDTRFFIRRVLALPGQRIAFHEGVPIVDGAPAAQTPAEDQDAGAEGRRLRERLGEADYVIQLFDGASDPRLREMQDITVPPGHVFLVGDNRDNSFDSRMLGPVPIEALYYRANAIIWSSDRNRIGRKIE